MYVEEYVVVFYYLCANGKEIEGNGGSEQKC
jgi:hypothetical protein